MLSHNLDICLKSTHEDKNTYSWRQRFLAWCKILSSQFYFEIHIYFSAFFIKCIWKLLGRLQYLDNISTDCIYYSLAILFSYDCKLQQRSSKIQDFSLPLFKFNTFHFGCFEFKLLSAFCFDTCIIQSRINVVESKDP